jgi:molybdopterin-guanine dinucleotide biosynthesis protein A
MLNHQLVWLYHTTQYAEIWRALWSKNSSCSASIQQVGTCEVESSD